MTAQGHMVRTGDIVTVTGWTSETPKQRLKVLATCDGYAWCRAEWPKRSDRYNGTHYTLALDQIEAAPRKGRSLKALKAAMAAAHPDKGGSPEAFIAARAAYEAAQSEERQA
jgi:hypothetical protein